MSEWDKETQRWEIVDGGDCWCYDCDEPINKELGTREIKSDPIIFFPYWGV